MTGTTVAYILECADGTLYVGSTNNLARRLAQHNTSKNGAHYTKIRRPVVLKYVEELPTLGAARSREAAIKKLRREQKMLLCRHDGTQANSAKTKDATV